LEIWRTIDAAPRVGFVAEIQNIVVLTGAGVSQESGLLTFRTMANGELGWDTGLTVHPVEDVATPEAFGRDPARVHKFYNDRRAQLETVEPNRAHRALARLDREWRGEFLLITQNVDNLHERAGSSRLIHMHGENCKAWCLSCDLRSQWDGPMDEGMACPQCGTRGSLRPDIVWFGEMPYEMDRIEDALRKCDLFVSIGTSGAVYPAAGFVQTARYCGARTLEINQEPSVGSIFFEESRIGKAGTQVPEWVEELLLAYSDHSRPISR
jgi:NAD-dependent deacetylase